MTIGEAVKLITEHAALLGIGAIPCVLLFYKLMTKLMDVRAAYKRTIDIMDADD